MTAAEMMRERERAFRQRLREREAERAYLRWEAAPKRGKARRSGSLLAR